MNYELCKKLKDAGFPQSNPSAVFHEVSGTFYRFEVWNGLIAHAGYHNWCNDWELPTEEDVRIPTLSELIEACGDNFRSLSKRVNDWNDWCAVGRKKDSHFEHYTSTPEMAVAELWLKLNEK